MHPYMVRYVRPENVAAAAQAGRAGGKFLAGGQSLVQAMKLRLTAPEMLVDLQGIDSLAGIDADGHVVDIGAMTSHTSVARSPVVRQAIPALSELAGWIGDPMVRNRGTLGGSIANADPAACYPAAVLALAATVHTDRRSIAAEAFFTGLYETALQEGELVTSVRFRIPRRAAYVKYRQPASRFALVGVFVACFANEVRVAVTGARSCVYRDEGLEKALARTFTPEAAREAEVSSSGVNSDLHGSAAYRTRMISVMAARAVSAANER